MPPRSPRIKRDFLDNKHDVYLANEAMWRRNEIRFKAGAAVYDELPRFAYERKIRSKESEHYLARKLMATYLNFGYDFAEMMAGQLMTKAATPEKGLNFDKLGKVQASGGGEPDRAELFYDNVDGVGNDGSMWPNFWTQSHIETYPFGHIFQFAEAPSRMPENQGQEITDGLRPYLKNFTALQGTDWCVSNGQFDYAIFRVRVRGGKTLSPGGRTVGRIRRGYYLLVREGFDGLEEDPEADFSEGGWFLFDEDKKFLRTADEKPEEARWEDALDGKIPVWLYYYMRDRGTEDVPAISRPGVTELLNCAVSYMAVSSAADSDFLEAAASVLYFLGADKGVMKAVAEQHAEGSKTVGVPRPRARQDSDVQIYDGSLGAVTAEVAETRLKRKLEEAFDLMLREATSTPDSSGESKRAGFGERKAPKLALHASELETAQTNAIDAVSKRWGIVNNRGSATMERDFDLAPLSDRIAEYFDIRNKASLKSPTADSKAFRDLVRDKLGITDEKTLNEIEAQVKAKMAADDLAASREASLTGAFGG